MKEQLIGSVARNLAETVRVEIVDQGAGPVVDLRIWSTPKASGDEPGLHPTGRGMTLAVEHAEELVRLLLTATTTIRMREAEHVGDQG